MNAQRAAREKDTAAKAALFRLLGVGAQVRFRCWQHSKNTARRTRVKVRGYIHGIDRYSVYIRHTDKPNLNHGYTGHACYNYDAILLPTVKAAGAALEPDHDDT